MNFVGGWLNRRGRRGGASVGDGGAPAATAEGRLRLSIADGLDGRELLIFADLRDTLVPRLTARLHELGHVVAALHVPSDARPFPGARFDCQVETVGGERLTVRCELRARRLHGGRVGSVRYAIVPAPG
jgi:hypothetical protein